MVNTEAMCRQQAAHHRQIAAAALLPNVRKIALAAANAWEVQAEEASRHASGSSDARSAEDAAIALEFLLEQEEGFAEPEDLPCQAPADSRGAVQPRPPAPKLDQGSAP